jgi:hypothetical protein
MRRRSILHLQPFPNQQLTGTLFFTLISTKHASDPVRQAFRLPTFA